MELRCMVIYLFALCYFFQFIAIAGDYARETKCRGALILSKIVDDLDAVQTDFSSSLVDPEACLKRLDTLATGIDTILGSGDLGFLHRQGIERSRDRLQELRRYAKVAFHQQLGVTKNALLTDRLKTLLDTNDSCGSETIAAPFQFTNVNKVTFLNR